jgi:predicted RNA-binding protein with PUA-like domain
MTKLQTSLELECDREHQSGVRCPRCSVDVLSDPAMTRTPMKTKTSKNSKIPIKNTRKTGASHWLVKQEPETYSWSDFVSDGRTDWTGVRNYQARNNLREMKTGERVLFYHSGKDKAVVGVAEVVKSAYPDPTADDEQWVAVDLKPIKALKNPVPLAAIRYDKRLSQLPLIRQSQLSVMSLTKDEFDILVATGEGKSRKK